MNPFLFLILLLMATVTADLFQMHAVETDPLLYVISVLALFTISSTLMFYRDPHN